MTLRIADGKARALVPVLRPRKCKHCRETFTPTRRMQPACSIPCALGIVETKKAAAERKATAEARVRLKTRRRWMAEAQSAFNAWIRLRDAALPCISCGRHHDGQWHAGHYLSTGARPELRFEPLNVHKQCQPCNTHLSGNLVLYRVGLCARIGTPEVEWLEGPHESRKWTTDDLREMRDRYRRMARESSRT
jgi:hypothetical protein